MAIDNTIAVVGIGYLFIYLTLYRKNRFISNILFFLTSLALVAYAPDDISRAIGMMLTLASLGSIVYDVLNVRANMQPSRS